MADRCWTKIFGTMLPVFYTIALVIMLVNVACGLKTLDLAIISWVAGGLGFALNIFMLWENGFEDRNGNFLSFITGTPMAIGYWLVMVTFLVSMVSMSYSVVGDYIHEAKKNDAQAKGIKLVRTETAIQQTADIASVGYATALLAPWSATVHSRIMWKEPKKENVSPLLWFLYHTRLTIVGNLIERVVHYFLDGGFRLFKLKPENESPHEVEDSETDTTATSRQPITDRRPDPPTEDALAEEANPQRVNLPTSAESNPSAPATIAKSYSSDPLSIASDRPSAESNPSAPARIAEPIMDPSDSPSIASDHPSSAESASNDWLSISSADSCRSTDSVSTADMSDKDAFFQSYDAATIVPLHSARVDESSSDSNSISTADYSETSRYSAPPESTDSDDPRFTTIRGSSWDFDSEESSGDRLKKGQIRRRLLCCNVLQRICASEERHRSGVT